MYEKLLGVILMAAPVLYVASLCAIALYRKQPFIEMDIAAVVVTALCWMAGRVLAGSSLTGILMGSM